MRPGQAVEVAGGVVVAADTVDGALAGAPAHPADRAGTAGLPAWRVAEALAARALLRRLLALLGNHSASTAPIRAEAGGRPYLDGEPGIGVSLSHDSGTVAAAVGVGHRVGIDVQGPVEPSPALLRRCCQPDVAARIAALPAPRRAGEFAAVWAVQEACVKAAGVGLAGRPWAVPVGFRPDRGRWHGYRWRVFTPAALPPVACAYLDLDLDVDLRR